MINDIKFNLSEADNRFLTRMEKNMARITIFYVAIGLSFCAAIAQLLAGIIHNQPARYLATIILVMVGTQGILLSYMFKRFLSIISQLKNRILELDLNP